VVPTFVYDASGEEIRIPRAGFRAGPRGFAGRPRSWGDESANQGPADLRQPLVSSAFEWKVPVEFIDASAADDRRRR